MAWRGFLAALGCAGLVAVAPATAAEDMGFSIATKGWVGGAYGEDGRFAACVVAAPFQRGITLFFSLSADTFLLALQKDGWRLGTAHYPLTLSVDEAGARRATGEAEDDAIWIDLSGDVAFYRALQKGRTLTVKAAREGFRFDLTGSSAALNQLAACSVRFTGRSPIGDPSARPRKEQANPFGGGKQAAAVSPELAFDAAEVEALLVEADFPRPALYAESELPLFEGQVPFLAWASEDRAIPAYGYLLYVRHTGEPRAALRDLFDLLVEACEGRVAAGYDPVTERDGVRVTGGRVLCEREEGTAVTYFAAARKEAGVYVFAHSGAKSTLLLLRDVNDKLKELLLGHSY